MRIIVTVQTRASQERVMACGDGMYKIWVRAAPERYKANDAVRRVLAAHFNVAPSRIRIIAGVTARRKMVEIDA